MDRPTDPWAHSLPRLSGGALRAGASGIPILASIDRPTECTLIVLVDGMNERTA